VSCIEPKQFAPKQRRHNLPAMSKVGAFPAKLDMAMRAASLSRVSLAHELAVDKSLIGRWLSGAVHPTEHNLERLTALLAGKIPGLRLANWYDPVEVLAVLLGVSVPADGDGAHFPAGTQFLPFLEAAMAETVRRGAAYEGFWRTSRPSVLVANTVFHDYGMVRCNDQGLLEVSMRGSGLTFHGWLFLLGGNLFVTLHDATGGTPMSLVFRGISLPKAMVLDGLLMLAALDGSRTLAAVPLVLERIGDLSGDRAADDARALELPGMAPAPFDPVPDDQLRSRLFRGAGPAGDRHLVVGPADSLSRGTTSEGLSG